MLVAGSEGRRRPPMFTGFRPTRTISIRAVRTRRCDNLSKNRRGHSKNRNNHRAMRRQKQQILWSVDLACSPHQWN